MGGSTSSFYLPAPEARVSFVAQGPLGLPLPRSFVWSIAAAAASVAAQALVALRLATMARQARCAAEALFPPGPLFRTEACVPLPDALRRSCRPPGAPPPHGRIVASA